MSSAMRRLLLSASCVASASAIDFAAEAAKAYDYFAHPLVSKTIKSHYPHEKVEEYPWFSEHNHTMDMFYGHPPKRTDVAELLADKSAIIVALPGAFTPTCSGNTIPGFLEKLDELKKAGVTELIFLSVNDGAVMEAWAKTFTIPKASGVNVHFLGDYMGHFAHHFGLMAEIRECQTTIRKKGLLHRFKRTTMYVVKGTFMAVGQAFADDNADEPDVFGDEHPEPTLVDAALEMIAKAKAKKIAS